MKPFRFYRVCTLVLSALMLVACGDDEQASTEKGKVVVPVTVAIVEVRDVQTQLRSIGRLVSRLFVAAPAQPGRGHRGTLGHPHDLERQNALEHLMRLYGDR